MLHVAVENQQISRHPAAARTCASAVRTAWPLPLRLGVRNHRRSRSARGISRRIGRPVVHDDDARDAAVRSPVMTCAIVALFVQGRHDRHTCEFTNPAPCSMAGRTSTEAITSVTTLTTDTTPIDRNGGYEELTSVP